MIVVAKDKKSVSVTVLLFGFVPLLNAEILTGSTSVDSLIANPLLILITLPLVLVTYAIPLAIICDVAIRFKFGLRTIFLSGLIYGIINEAVFAKTLVASYWPGAQFTEFRFLGLNILWVPEILIFHAVISTTVTILVIRNLWPQRIAKSFLERKHYVSLSILLALAIVVTNVVLVPFVARNIGYASPFDPLPYFVIFLLELFIVFLMRASLSQVSKFQRTGFSVFRYALLGGALLLLLTLGSHIALAVFGAWFTGALIVLAGCFFYWYFMSLDLSDYTARKAFFVYSTFIISVLILGFGGRQTESNIVAFAGVALELFFGWRATTTRQVQIITP
jgi:hypothetical protein